MNSLRFVSMNAGKEADANWIIAALGPDEQVARQIVKLTVRLKTSRALGDKAG